MREALRRFGDQPSGFVNAGPLLVIDPCECYVITNFCEGDLGPVWKVCGFCKPQPS
jgi:hypothetical protein